MTNRVKRSIGLSKSGEKSVESRPSSEKHWLVVDEGFSRNTPDKSGSISKLYHDIRTQLYVIIGFVELMLDEVPGKINDEQRHNLKDVLNSGERLLELLNDIVNRTESEPGGPGKSKTREGL